jgi:hypothetical protein
MSKKKETKIEETVIETTSEVVTPVEITEEVVEQLNDVLFEPVKEETPVISVVKEEEEEVKQKVVTVTADVPSVVEIVIDEPIVSPKNIVQDIELKTEFEVGDSVKVNDVPFTVVKVKTVKSYDLEDQFGIVKRDVHGLLVQDNSVNFASFVAKANENI